MQNRPPNSRSFFSFFASSIFVVVGLISAACFASAQNPAAINPAPPASTQPSADRPWMNPHLSPEERADLVLKQMTLDEKIALLHGNGMAHAAHWQMPLTELANGGAGLCRRRRAPRHSAASSSPTQPTECATAAPTDDIPQPCPRTWERHPAGMSTPHAHYGAVIGSELRAQGFDMTLGGGMDLARDPRNGRTFEYAGEDPLLAGTLVGNMMKCEQAQHIVGDIKHYAMNDQETGRNIVNAVISKRAMQESDLLAFHIAISIANPGAVMCSYNRVNGDYACENSYTLNEVLEETMGLQRLCGLRLGRNPQHAKSLCRRPRSGAANGRLLRA